MRWNVWRMKQYKSNKMKPSHPNLLEITGTTLKWVLPNSHSSELTKYRPGRKNRQQIAVALHTKSALPLMPWEGTGVSSFNKYNQNMTFFSLVATASCKKNSRPRPLQFGPVPSHPRTPTPTLFSAASSADSVPSTFASCASGLR